MTRHYLIIGTGPAAIAASQSIHNLDPNGSLILLGEDPYGFYSRPGLAYYINREIRGRELLLQQATGLQYVKGRAVAVNPQEHIVILANRRIHTYDRLLIATGSKAMGLSIPGIDLTGVFKLDDMEDAQRFIKLVAKNKTAVVTGGGITALEIVEALISHGVETHYVFRGPRYWPNVLDEVESSLVEKRLKNEGVRLYPSSQLTQIIGRKGKVAGVETDKGLHVSCQMVGVAIGVQPRLELAASAGLKTDRGILTDEYLQTSAPDIFAAGDVAQVLDPITGKHTLEMLWSKALAQGRTAGSNMTGAHTLYEKSIPLNVTRLAGITTTIIGSVGVDHDNQVLSISRGESETWRHYPDANTIRHELNFNRTRIIVGAKNIVGAVVMGDQALSRSLYHLIAKRADITPIRAHLMAAQAPVVEIIIEFWSAWRKSNGTQ